MIGASVRPPAVAGRFYPRDAHELSEEVHTYLADRDSNKRISALACMVPHAGYMYSGPVAGAVFGAIEIPQICLIMCPNHTGMGRPLAIMSAGMWATPLGDVPIDSEFASALKNRCPLLSEDASAHRAEHAIEVELPFLLSIQPKLKFVPITVGTSQYEALDQLGDAIAGAVAAYQGRILIVASSDMNHYESDALTRVKDQMAIDALLGLEARGLYDVVTQQKISMCGLGPAVAMLTATRKLGATTAKLLKYATSGDVSGDRDMVVGYAGIAIY